MTGAPTPAGEEPAARLPAPADGDSTAPGTEILIVAEEPAPAEDPLLAAAFGPAREIGGGVAIILAAVTPAAAAPPHVTPLGTVEIVDGQVALRLTPSRRLQVARGLLVAWTCLWLAWLLRRRLRGYE